MVVPRTNLSQLVTPYLAQLSRMLARPDDASAYGPWISDGRLFPISIQEGLSPRFSQAKVGLNLAELGCMPWQWRSHLAIDDQVQLVSAHPDPKLRHCPFAGFVVDVDWNYDTGANVTITANGMAFRLARDIVVHGRYLFRADNTIEWFTGLAASFNHGGLPNRREARIQDPVLLAALGVDADSVPALGLPIFTYDGDPKAKYWAPADCLDYLMWFYNAQETWLDNCELDLEDYSSLAAPVVNVEGLSLWAAMAAVGDRSGHDISEYYGNDGENGNAICRLDIQRRGEGTVLDLMHQATGTAGELAELDMDKTNLFAASVAEDASCCVTAPIVAGGAILYEVSVLLMPAWDPADLEDLPRCWLGQPSDQRIEYCRRYMTGGLDFGLYGDVGRLWDANTDGFYSKAPWNLAQTDAAALAGLQTGSWPRMPYPPLPCLTRSAYIWYGPGLDWHMPESLESWLEISLDAGTHWQPLRGYNVLKDRLGVRLTCDNLLGVQQELEDAPGPSDPSVNLFDVLLSDPTNVRVRLTCTIAGPDRHIEWPSPTGRRGTAFEAAEWYDRGAAGAIRARWSTPEGLAATSLPSTNQVDESDGKVLAGIAKDIQSIVSGRAIEASLPLEWPDKDVRLTNVIRSIAGIDYDLGTDVGAAKAYPRVVGRTLHLTPETWSQTLVLGSDRKSAMPWANARILLGESSQRYR